MSDQFTIEQADELSRIVRESLHPGFAPSDDTLTAIEIRQMADGSGDWAVFVATYDVAVDEHTFRHIVNAAGSSRETPLNPGNPEGWARGEEARAAFDLHEALNLLRDEPQEVA